MFPVPLVSLLLLLSVSVWGASCLKDLDLLVWLSHDGSSAVDDILPRMQSMTFLEEMVTRLSKKTRSVRLGFSLFGDRTNPPADTCYMDVVEFSDDITTTVNEIHRYLKDFRPIPDLDDKDSLAAMAYIAANKFGKPNPEEARVLVTLTANLSHFEGDGEISGDLLPLPVQPTDHVVCDSQYTYVGRDIVGHALDRSRVMPVIITHSNPESNVQWSKLFETMDIYEASGEVVITDAAHESPARLTKKIVAALESQYCTTTTTKPPRNCLKTKKLALWFNHDGTRTFEDLMAAGVSSTVMSKVLEALEERGAEGIEFGMGLFGDRQERLGMDTCYVNVLDFTGDKIRGMARIGSFLGRFGGINGSDGPEDSLSAMAYVAGSKFAEREREDEVRILVTLADEVGHHADNAGLGMTGGDIELPMEPTEKVVCDRRYKYVEKGVVGEALKRGKVMPVVLTFRDTKDGQYAQEWKSLLESIDVYPDNGEGEIIRLDGMNTEKAAEEITLLINRLVCNSTDQPRT